MKAILKFSTFLFMLAILVSCSRNPVTGKREALVMSEEREIALGTSYDPQVVASFGLYDDDKIQNFINVKGNEMAKISHRPHLNYTFRVLDSPVVNAFAVPGGYVYFTRGILAHFNNEAEFAGVLGHEIGHITARHSAKQQRNQILGQVGLIAGVIFSPGVRSLANEASQALGLLFLSFSRGNESESDELGVEYSTAVGYDSHEMADFFQTLKRLSGDNGGVPTFLSTHPDPGDRFNRVHQMSTAIQAQSNLKDLKINRDEYLALIDGMKYAEDPQQGYTDGNIFYHPALTFQFPYPNGWRLVNSPSAVQMAPSDGKAIIVFSLGQGATLQEVAQQEVQTNEFNVIESSNVQVNGYPAIAMISEQAQTDPNTGQVAQTLRILSYYIQKDNIIYKFHGLSLKEDFNANYSAMQSTMKGFKKLSDASRINVEAAVIDIVTINQQTTLQAALTKEGIEQSRLNELAIVNGMELNETLKSGDRIKVVRGKIWQSN